jgi:predicted ATP-binding protein involved in virulence
MRITRIFVEKLFGIFDHEIPLNLSDRITIIHAPNGYGKTVILKMLNGLFNVQYTELLTIPYRSFHVEFDDQRRIVVRRSLGVGEEGRESELSFTLYSNKNKKLKSFTVKYSKNSLGSEALLAASQDFLRGYSPYATLLYGSCEEKPSTEEDLDCFGDQISVSPISGEQDDHWLTEIREEATVYLIESQRLLNLSRNGNIRKYRKNGQAVPQSTVNMYSDELVQEIKKRSAKYASVSQSLDRSFPARVLRQKIQEFREKTGKLTNSDSLTNEDLRNKWDELEKYRNRLVESGLLERDEEQNLSIQTQEIDKSTKNVLVVYIEDVEKKLAVFGDIAAKIDLFRRIINSKFSYKEIVVSREKGFIFRSKYPEGSEHHGSELLSPSSLSSGEQHELILLYELLFKVKEKSLVLIDEPELSLHIGWQVNFLEDLQEISKLADLDLLIATHAPDLISDRWDLTVELKGV